MVRGNHPPLSVTRPEDPDSDRRGGFELRAVSLGGCTRNPGEGAERREPELGTDGDLCIRQNSRISPDRGGDCRVLGHPGLHDDRAPRSTTRPSGRSRHET